MVACRMVIFMVVYVAATAESAVPSPDAKKIDHLGKQVQILSNLVHAQSNIMAKFSCQGQSGTSSNPTSECILKIANQAKNIAKLQGEINALDTLSKTQGSQIQQLQSSVKDLSKKITAQETKLTSVDTKYASEVSKLHSEIKSVDQKSNNLGSTVANLGTQVKQLAGAWPSGKYCILASGACPAGFSRSSAHMRAISLYAGTGSYIKQGSFGDSKIQCHGRCGQYGHWTGELYLTACCK